MGEVNGSYRGFIRQSQGAEKYERIARNFKGRAKPRINTKIKLKERGVGSDGLFDEVARKAREERINRKVLIVKPFAIEHSGRIDEHYLLNWAAYIENLPGTAAIYHGKNGMFGRIGIEEDRNSKYLLSQMPFTRRLHFLAGFGALCMPKIGNFHEVMAFDECFGLKRKADRRGFYEFAWSLCDVGWEFTNIQTDEESNGLESMNNSLIKISKDEIVCRDICQRFDDFSGRRQFNFMRERYCRGIMDTRYVYMRQVVRFEKEHPGRDYMGSVIKCLKSKNLL